MSLDPNSDPVGRFLTRFPESLTNSTQGNDEIRLERGALFFLDYLQSPGISNLMNQTMPSTVGSSEVEVEGYLLAHNAREILIPTLKYFLQQKRQVPSAYTQYEETLTDLLSNGNNLINRINHQLDIQKILEGSRKIFIMALRRQENFQDFAYDEGDVDNMQNLLEMILERTNDWR